MNLCFVTNQYVSKFSGGIESVTLILSSMFAQKGYNTFLLSARRPMNSSLKLRNQFVLPNSTIDCKENRQYISSFIKKHHIDIFINQSEVKAILELIKSCSSTTPVISVIHTDPKAAIKAVQDNWDFWKLQYGPIKFILLSPYLYLRRLYQMYTRKKYTKEKHQYYHYQSDAVVLLSEKFFKSFKKISGITKTSKLFAISNPSTVNTQQANLTEKENIVLFVGRLVFQKRLDRLFRIWKRIKDTKDWKLIILGDGPDKVFYETLCKKWNVKNIEFAGQCDPHPFYHKAKILCMTSSFEGSPCVLQEAIQNGIVPIVFNSFESATDIIDNKRNGFLIKPFSIKEYSRTLEQLISKYNYEICSDNNILEPAEEDKIYLQWESLFKCVTN